MPKLTVEVDLDLNTWLRAKRSHKKITTHTLKYINKNCKPRASWIILSTEGTAGSRPVRLRGKGNNSVHVRFVHTSKLTINDLGYWIGYIGDNDQKYIFGLPKVKTGWGLVGSIYGMETTTRKNAFKKLKERLGEYLKYANEQRDQERMGPDR